MPPTIPVKGIPCVAVVFAQLYVNNECRGPRPFLVNLNDGYDMCKGVTSKQVLSMQAFYLNFLHYPLAT